MQNNYNTLNIKLMQGDCLQLLNGIPSGSVDLILCDLPYAVTACKWDILIPMNDFVCSENGELLNQEQYLKSCYLRGVPFKGAVEQFEKNKQLGLWSHYHRVIKNNGAIVLFGQEPFSTYLRQSNLSEYKYDWYWEKERLTNISQVKRRAGKTVETISVFYAKQPTYNPQMIKYDGPPRTNKIKNGKLGKLTDGQMKKPIEYKDTGYRYPTQVLRYQRDCLTSNFVDTQKPVKLCEFLIKTFSNLGETVLDNCMGSGTTGVACINTNRKFIGIEKDPERYTIAENRIKEYLNQL
jgi:site-specific DNA-methyltransferase (adenine-specific)